MIKISYPKPVEAWEFLEIFLRPRNVVPEWLRLLRRLTRDYMEELNAHIYLSEKPYNGYSWIARALVIEALRN